MPLTRLAYKIGKATLRRVPAWVLRVRPFAVYAIPTERFTAPQDCPAGPPTEVIRWVASTAEAESLAGLAAEENVAEWDGVDRRAAIVLDRDEPIACAWVARHEYLDPDLTVRVTLAEGDRWLYAAVVRPEHRRGGVYTRLLRFVGQQAHAEGAARIVLGVIAGNEASLRAHSKWSPTELAKVTVVRAMGGVFCRTSGAIERISKAEPGAHAPLTLEIGVDDATERAGLRGATRQSP